MCILTKQDFLIHMRSLHEFMCNCEALRGIVNTSYTDSFVDSHVKLLEYAFQDYSGLIGDYVFETLPENMNDKGFEQLYNRL